MKNEYGTFSKMAFRMNIGISELINGLETNPFFGGYKNTKYNIEDYDFLDSESMEYEIRVIIKGRYRK